MRRYSLILKPILLLAPKVDLSQKVLESLFNISKSPEYEPKTMNWKNVATKLQSLAPLAQWKHSSVAQGDEYHAFGGTAKEHWDSMRSYYQKAAMTYSRGAREHAGYLAEQVWASLRAQCCFVVWEVCFLRIEKNVVL
ncbi:hypothetical protein D8674_037621 [Pyrus ussuriensis x Pyrus communis]|uniref:Uncharacterized protein n=1 Tax=Pyrus ussuriensis x Pyrus communis TaxID=2448454 RepID=A0A5N5GY35_9ROSA|nr:hypothetical protein D8674_037621 [Pyrus ussuriensis x Pyrus communis]